MSSPGWRDEEHMARAKGTIKRLVTEKSVGFIAAEGGVEYFFHRSACSDGPFDQLREGQSVKLCLHRGLEVRAARSPRGWWALGMRPPIGAPLFHAPLHLCRVTR